MLNKNDVLLVETAKKYFGKRIDFYADGGTLNLAPSSLVVFHGKKIVRLR